MKVNNLIGITGGIGSGKSTVSRFWASYANLPLINIDELCRELLEVEKPGWVALKASLDKPFFDTDGRLNRSALRSALFADDGLRKAVDQLMHPLALDLFLRKTVSLQGVILVDVPLLYEAGWEDKFVHTVVVYADQVTCCRRLSRRDNISVEEAIKAIFAQMTIGEKAMLADHVVDNRYCWLHTRAQLVHLAGWIRNCFSGEL